ncbi:MAG TPA: protein translocase subunit SecD [Verrucomicrobiae bacterium]|jgi:SecD/SecF fusion protein|nr:protein translocase subunit SecD [Verrucomicrobiae bacterium]
MNRNNLGKFIFVVLVVVWSFYEMYPPVSRDLAVSFEEKAVRKDPAFTQIMTHFKELQAAHPQREFSNLMESVGTNDLSHYFPFYDVKGELNPNRAVLNRLQREGAGKIRLGLDLQGGTSFLVEMQTNRLENATNSIIAQEGKEAALSQAAEVLRKRVDKFGVAEPVIQPQGDNRILIQLPGLSEADKDAARASIQEAAYLELRIVHENSDQLLKDGLVEPGYEILKEKDTEPDGTSRITPYLVKKKPELTGAYITSAFMSRDEMGRPEINFTLNSQGADIFGQVTRDNIGRLLAIVLDGELQSAPRINSAIENGSGVITGHFTDAQAQQLANVLENPLQAPVKIIAENSVDPTLGSDTVKSGVTSAVLGTVFVAAFMMIYYMFAGAVADIALITNIIILLGVMCSIGTTLTLPGIAGVVLTIGMAVDANVLIFERIREESAKGKSLRGALQAGYDRAFGTIFDSHVTTLISSVILIYMGTGPIKGFGVTLTIGVAASLFTALVVTRLIFDFLIARGMITKIRMLHLIPATLKLDFMKLAKPAFALSWTIIIVGLAYGIFVRGDKMMGISFKGGDNLIMGFTQKVDAEKIRTALTKEAGVFDPVVQYQQDIVGGGAETLSITSENGTSPKVESVLKKDFPEAGFIRKGSENVGPTIGKEIQTTAILASLASLFGILIYVAFRYEFSFAVGAVLAVIHDVLMTIGCYCLTGLFGHGREFNATMVAAVLTIIGFSINDTIVIFDRIREDLKLGVRGSFKELINQALNQTLSRTLITSGTVLIATLSLYIFGGGAINDFAFTFLVGIITGTYSSIYIASALVLWWHKGARPKTGSQVVVVENRVSTARG